MQDPLIRLPGYALRRAATAMSGELAQRLAEIALRQSDVSVLMLIEANPLITASAIGRALDIQRANMVPLLKRLEDAQLIGRKPIDGKSQGLSLTPTGVERLGQAHDVIQSFEESLIARVPAAHREHLLPALNALWR